MKSLIKKVTALLTLLVFFSSYTVTTKVYADETSDNISTQPQITADEYFEMAVSLIMTKYKFDVEKENLYKKTVEYLLKENPELLQDAFKGLFDSLDKYSVYYTEEQLNSFITDISGEFCGIGVLVTTVDTGLLITNVYDNSPAKENGLLNGDIITMVEDISLAGMDISIAQGHILGEENTPVKLTVNRNNTVFEINPIRRKVIIDSGFYQTLENDTIGYISLFEFDDHAAEFTKKALNYFDEKSIQDVIIDLRNNPGGSVNTMVDMCSLFTPTGPAIHFEFKNPFRNTTLYAYNENPKYNVIVLVNETSASASEAFSAAIQDYGVGIVVGTQTYGKGTMQNITKFKIGGGAKITEAEYLSAKGRVINNVGVSPDVYVKDKVVAYDQSNYQRITYERVMKKDDVGQDVYALEERLYFLGYDIGLPDNIYGDDTHNAVLSFQRSTGLYPYGVADITTQLKLESILKGHDVVQNDSLHKAIDIFKNHNWEDYKLDWSHTESDLQK